jgi:hypothetical protein
MKITVNQLRRIIREEIEKTVRLNEGLGSEQLAQLDALKNKWTVEYPEKFPGLFKVNDTDLSGYRDQESLALELNKHYKDILSITGAHGFDTPEAKAAIMYMFPKADKQTVMMSCEVADLQGGRKFKEIPKELPGIKYKPEDEFKYKPGSK